MVGTSAVGVDPSGLVRGRLNHLFSDASDFRVGLIVAPAGSGKSTLAAHVARDHRGPVAWCDVADRTPRTEQALVSVLVTALGDHVGAVGSIDELIDALSGLTCPVLIVIDDAHVLDGSEAEPALAALVDRVPPPVRLLLASRVNLALDLSRARVSGRLVEAGLEDLRFRTWEVEQLFGGVYRDHLGPEDVATVTRRTEGWAAYLQLFHLAIARKTPVQRRQLLSSLSNPSRLVRDYLSRQVLAGLSDELRDFLIHTSVLRRPTPQLCDELLERTGSAEVLAELERRQVFTERIEVDDSYRYHAVMLAYLDSRLLETVGLDEARRQHLRAAALLERTGYVEESITAYAKAEDWTSVRRLLEHLGVAGDGSVGDALLDQLSPSTLDGDPWLLMTKARRALRRGALREAVGALVAAEASASGPLADRCRAQRAQIASWLFSDPAAGGSWSGLLRSATQRIPREVARQAGALGEPTGRLVEAAGALLAGDVRRAERTAKVIVGHPDSDTLSVAAAQVVFIFAILLAGRELDPKEVELLRELLEAADTPWLDRQVRSLMSLAKGGGRPGLDAARRACQADGDRWGEALIVTYGAGFEMVTGPDGPEGFGAARAAAGFEEAASAFGDLGAGVLETWAFAYSAVSWCRAGDRPRAAAAAQHSRTLAGLREVPGAGGMAALVLGVVAGDERQLSWAEHVLEPLGLWTGIRSLVIDDRRRAPAPIEELAAADAPAPAPRRQSDDAEVFGQTVLRCLGGFSLVVDGRRIDEASAKPMERATLHLLAMRAGEAVHREELGEVLWPGADPEAARHRLQVAVSALRRLVGSDWLLRKGDAYCLALPEEAEVDLWQLRDASRAATIARTAGDVMAEGRALEGALAAYRGPMLPGDGPADWVIGPRSAAQALASDAAIRLAGLRRDGGDLEGAAGAARQGLEIDRYRDDLWRMAISVAEEAGHQAGANQLRAGYDAMLDEIGVGPAARAATG